MKEEDLIEFALTIATDRYPEFVLAARHAGIRVSDTGDRITTDAGIGAEMVTLVGIPAARPVTFHYVTRR